VPPLSRTLLVMLAFMVSFVGVAGFGHAVNDLFDIDADRRAGKANTMQARPGWQRLLLLGGLLALGVAPWWWLPANRWNLALLGLQLLLLTLYAMPPVRLKTRSIGGLITDALYAYTVPALIACATFGDLGKAGPARPALMAAIVAWSLCAGMRGILNHQCQDVDNDRRSRLVTFATRHGAESALRQLAGVVLPAEIICFVALSLAIAGEFALYLPALAAFIAWRVFQLAYLWDAPLGLPWRLPAQTFVTHYGERLLGEYYVAWFPVYMLVALALRSPTYLVLAALHLALFKTGVVHFFVRDLRYLPGAIGKMRRRRG
jgi:4-hydroxybenzoate polyprenyltransferase